MSKDKYTKTELRQQDAVTQELQKGFEWTVNHVRLVFGIIVALLVIGAGWATYNWSNEKNEKELQSQYFKFEKEIIKKKESFDRHEAFLASKKDNKDPKKKDTKIDEGVASTGDMDKDFGSSVQGLVSIVTANPKSRAAALSAILLTDIYSKYNKQEDGLNLLQKIQKKDGTLNILAQNLKASLLANKNDCAQAVTIWGDLINQKDAEFVHGEARLHQALCYELMNESAKAEANYNKIIADNKDSRVAKTAEKYLRLLKIKTN